MTRESSGGSGPRILSDYVRELTSVLRECGYAHPQGLVRRWISLRTGLTPEQQIISPQVPLSQKVVDELSQDILDITAGKPFSRLEGRQGFWSLDLKISPATLDPRADTETLVARVIDFYGDRPPELFLDLGTGSGCIALALLQTWPDSHAVAVDKSVEALLTARENARDYGLAERCDFVCSDWTHAVSHKFSCVVANPPYIATQEIQSLSVAVRKHDPILALDGGPDGLRAYEMIFSDLKRVLKPPGQAFLEIGYDQSQTGQRLAEKHGFSVHAIHADSGGLPRVLQMTYGDKF